MTFIRIDIEHRVILIRHIELSYFKRDALFVSGEMLTCDAMSSKDLRQRTLSSCNLRDMMKRVTSRVEILRLGKRDVPLSFPPSVHLP